MIALLVLGCAGPGRYAPCDWVPDSYVGEVWDGVDGTRPVYECDGYWICYEAGVSVYHGQVYHVSGSIQSEHFEEQMAELQALECARCNWAGKPVYPFGWEEVDCPWY